MKKLSLLLLLAFMLPWLAPLAEAQSVSVPARTRQTSSVPRLEVVESILVDRTTDPTVPGKSNWHRFAKSFTMMAWYKVTAFSTSGATYGNILIGHQQRCHANSNGSFLLGVSDSGKLIYRGKYATTDSEIEHKNIGTMADNAEISLNEWFHLAFSYDLDNTRIDVYLNGEKVGEEVLAEPLTMFPDDPGIFTFGASGAGACVDDAAIYDKVLDGAAIKSAMIDITAGDPICLYTFNDVKDATGAENLGSRDEKCMYYTCSGSSAADGNTSCSYFFEAIPTIGEQRPAWVAPAQTYTFTVNVTGEGTATIKDADNVEYQSGDAIDVTKDLTVFFAPAEGWHLASVLWSGEGDNAFGPDEYVNELSGNFIAIGNLDMNQTLDVTFEKDAAVLEPTLIDVISGADYDVPTAYTDVEIKKYNATWKGQLHQSIAGILQMRGTKPSGLVMTEKREGAKVEKIIFHWYQGVSGNNKNTVGRSFNFYAKDTPYENGEVLYATGGAATVEAQRGKQLDGGCTFGSYGDDNTAVNNLDPANYNNDVLQVPTYDTEFVIPAEYQDKYLAFKPTSGAAFFASIEVVYVDPNAVPETPKYVVNIAEPENGTLTVTKADESVVANGDEVEEGTVLNIAATAAEGYQLEAITVNGTAFEGETYTVAGETTIAATFVAIPAAEKNMAFYKASGGSATYTTRLLVDWEVLGKQPLVSYDPEHGLTEINTPEDYSIGFWYKATSINYTFKGQLFKQGTPTHANANGHIAIYSSNSGDLSLQVSAGDNVNLDKEDCAPTGLDGFNLGNAPLNAWHYILFVVNNSGKKAQIYVDNEKKLDSELDQPINAKFGDVKFHFGSLGFAGYIDQVEFYNAALSPAEARQAIQDPTKVAKLCAYYTFDEVVDGNKFASVVPNDYKLVNQYCSGQNWGNGPVNVSITDRNPETAESDRVPIVLPELQKYNVYVSRPEIGSYKLWANGQEIENDTDVEEGTEVTVEAIAPEGYELNYIKVNNEQIEGNKFVVTKATTVLIFFKKKTYSLSVTVPEGAGWQVFNGETPVADFAAIEHGTALRFRMTVPAGETIETFTVNGEPAELTDSEYAFTMTGNVEIVVTFRAKVFYTVTIAECENGSIAVMNGETAVESGAQIGEGTTLTVVATAAEGYELEAVTVNGEPIEGTSFALTADATVGATFREKGLPDYCTSDLTNARADSRGLRSVKASYLDNSITFNTSYSSRSAIYEDHTDQVLVVEPGATIKFERDGAGGTWMHSYIYIDYNNDHVFTPVLDPNNYAVLEGSELVWFNRYSGDKDPKFYDSEGNEYNAGSNGHNAEIGGTNNVTIPASLAPGDYRVRVKVDWNSIDPCGNPGEDAAHKNRIDETGGKIADFIIRVEEAAPYTVTLANPDELGKVEFVDPETDELTVTTTSVVTVKATPVFDDVYFVNWTDAEGNEVSREAQFTYTGLADITLNANFEIRFSVAINAGEGGTLKVTTRNGNVENGALIKAGTEVTIVAKANGGMALSYLSVNNVNVMEEYLEEDSYTFELEENTAIEAEFAEAEYKVIATVEPEEGGRIFVSDDVEQDTAEPIDEYPANATFKEGTPLYIGAKANANYTLVYFELDGDVYYDAEGEYEPDDDFVLGNAEPVTTCAMAYGAYDDMPVTARFKALVALDSISIDNLGNAEVYNLQGVRVARENVVPGIYIIRANNEARKVYVK